MEKKVNISFENAEAATPVVATIDIDLSEFSQVAVPALPTADGEYKLVVAAGVYTWVEIL